MAQDQKKKEKKENLCPTLFEKQVSLFPMLMPPTFSYCLWGSVLPQWQQILDSNIGHCYFSQQKCWLGHKSHISWTLNFVCLPVWQQPWHDHHWEAFWQRLWVHKINTPGGPEICVHTELHGHRDRNINGFTSEEACFIELAPVSSNLMLCCFHSSHGFLISMVLQSVTITHGIVDMRAHRSL